MKAPPLSMLAAGVMALNIGVAGAQAYPVKPIRMVTTAPGGGSDFAARVIALAISGPLTQQVIVDNRAGGVVAVETVAKAPADGYTMLLYANSMWIAPFLQAVSYDTLRDFSPITLAASSPNMLVVHPSVPVTSVKELIALARAKPGELNYSSSGSGSSTHLAGEVFNSMAGVKIVRIAYKAAGPAITDVIGGQVQVMFPTVGSITPHVKSGRVRGLAVTTSKPSILAPGLPTVAAAGLPGYESVSVVGLFTPAKTPRPVIDRLNHEIVAALNRTDVKDKFLNDGDETVGSTPEQFAATIKSEMARLGKVIKDAGIHAD